MTASLPSSGTQEYLWWRTGAEDEAIARDKDLTGDAKQLRDLLESLAKRHPEWTIADLARHLAMFACPDTVKRKYRK